MVKIIRNSFFLQVSMEQKQMKKIERIHVFKSA